MTQFLYDGQTTTVQAAAVVALAAARTAIAGTLKARGANAAAALARDLPALALLAPDASTNYAAALQGLLADYVAAVMADATAGLNPSPAPPAGYAFASRLPPANNDPSWGLAALAFAPLAIPSGAAGQILMNWQALAQLLAGSATAALASLYAQSAFASSADADTARAQIFGLIVAQIESGAGNDPLIQAWRGALTAAVADLTTRAKQLPNVAMLSTLWPLPALVVAELLYQDGTQAPALVQRNAAPHPLFLPLQVEYLAS